MHRNLICKVDISDIFMPGHEIVIMVEDQEAKVSQVEQSILYNENARVILILTAAHSLISNAPYDQASKQEMYRDHQPPDGYIGYGCIIPPCKAHHDGQAREYQPLADSILNVPVSQVPRSESECHF